MIEVFLIGALVSIVKLTANMDVRPGVGLVSLLVLTLLITFLAGRSTRGLWTYASPEVVPSPDTRARDRQ
jgi:paraquat-inducible protein A